MQAPILKVLRMLKQFFCSNYQWLLDADYLNLLYNNKAIINIQLTFN